jgi:hypothetical protein
MNASPWLLGAALLSACCSSAPRVVGIPTVSQPILVVDEPPPVSVALPHVARVVRTYASDGVHVVFDWDQPARDVLGDVRTRVSCPPYDWEVAPVWLGAMRMEAVLPWSAATQACTIQFAPGVREPVRYRFDLGGG